MPGSRYATWAQMVASGNADDFFASFPSDEELTEKLNGFLPGSVKSLSSKLNATDRDSIDCQGEVIAETTNLPARLKHVILNKARQL